MGFLILLRNFFSDLSLSILSLIKILIVSKPVNKLPCKRKEECIILGNGPSLKDSLNICGDKTADFDLICVNFFAETDLYEKLKPRYYVLNPREFFLPVVIDSLMISRKKLFEKIRDNTTWEMFLFIPAQIRRYRQMTDIVRQNKNITIQYYNQTPIEGFRYLSHLFFGMRLGMPRPHNVIIPSLMLAIGMKYRNIWLFGAEHSWLKEITVDDSNNVLVNQKHFYDENSAKAETMRGAGDRKRKLHEVLEKFLLSFKGYHIIQDYSRKKDIKIFNSTPGSFIDAFEKKTLNI